MTEMKVSDLAIEVRNPADGKVVGEVRNETVDTVGATARELRLFQPEWEAIGPKGRKTWLLKYQDWVLDNTKRIADMVQSESGKTRAEALTEPVAVADLLNYWAGNAEKFLADAHPTQLHPMAVEQEAHALSIGPIR